MNSFFSAESVVKRYADHLALDKVSIQVKEGSIFGLLGPNGAGKTTLIRIINQITAPDEGAVYFMNEHLKPAHAELIGYLPEERGLYKKMKVGEQALYLAQLKGLSKKEAIAQLKIWFEKFDLISWWNKKVEELSKGMQQKIQFIITILHKPKLLIFDEPFSGFDPINANLLKDEILNLKKNGATIIFSTHNMASVEELCDNIALINKSKKILDGSVKEIRSKYKTNLFAIQLAGNTELSAILNDNFKIDSIEKVDEICKANIKIIRNGSPNHLLQVLLPHYEIKAFHEILPSMNDIFITKVQEDSVQFANSLLS